MRDFGESEDPLWAEIHELETKIEELEFELEEANETIREMDYQSTFLAGFIDYMKRAGHWGYVERYFTNYFNLLENRRDAASDALRNFIFTQEGRSDLF